MATLKLRVTGMDAGLGCIELGKLGSLPARGDQWPEHVQVAVDRAQVMRASLRDGFRSLSWSDFHDAHGSLLRMFSVTGLLTGRPHFRAVLGAARQPARLREFQ